MEVDNSYPFPPPSMPMAMPDGTPTRMWYELLLRLFDRTGGAVPPSDVSDLIDKIVAIQAQADFQSVQMSDPAVQDLQRSMQELIAQIPPAPNLSEILLRLDAMERGARDSGEPQATSRRAEEIEGMLAEMRPAQTVLEQWNAPTLQNSWVNFGGSLNPAGYWKDPHNVVHLRGVLMSGTVNATMFLLPVGYRPANEELFSVVSNNAFGRLDVRAAGDVVLVTGSNSFASLDGITFRAAT